MQEDKPNYYAVLPARVRYSKEISSRAKLLYAEISALANSKGFCYAQNKYFSDLYDVDAKTISRIIAELKDKGFISIENENTGNRKIFPLEFQPHNTETIKFETYNCKKIPFADIDKIVQVMDKNVLHNINTNIININNKDVDMLITYVDYQFLSHFKRKASEKDVDNFVDNSRKYGTSKVIAAFGEAFRDNVSNWAYIEGKLKKTIKVKEIQVAADKKKVTENVFKELTKDEAAETGKVIAELLESLKMPEKPTQTHTDHAREKKKEKPTPKLIPGSDEYTRAQREFQDKLKQETN